MPSYEDSIESRLDRVRFEAAAATIQYRVTNLLLKVEQLLSEFFGAAHLPQSGSARAALLKARLAELSYDWSKLEVPEVVRDEWAALSAAFDRLMPLMEELDRFENGTERPRREEIIRLQKAFTDEIDRMNVVERRLLSKEQGMA
jgi:hypothetical protein